MRRASGFRLELTILSAPTLQVAVVHVHPDHQAGNYTADLAVLELAERAVLDWFVRPVCLDWAGPDALGAVVGRVGTVVGWGTNVPVAGHALSAEPRAARLPIVSQETCLRSRPEFLHVTSERTFCAGFRNGTVRVLSRCHKNVHHPL